MTIDDVIIYMDGISDPFRFNGGLKMYQYIRDAMARKKDFIEIIQKAPTGNGTLLDLIPTSKIIIVQLAEGEIND